MATYRLYWIGSDDRIRWAENVECGSDAEACELAKQRIGEFSAIEVWCMATCVARIGKEATSRSTQG
jgi:hypothetical protein